MDHVRTLLEHRHESEFEMTSDKTVLFRPRFLAEVDKKLRDMIFRRGELVKLIVLMIKTVDLTTVPLLEISSEIQELSATTVKLPEAIHKKLKRAAQKRNSTMNALLNSAIWAYEADLQDNQPKSH
jgi:hypothetical protein